MLQEPTIQVTYKSLPGAVSERALAEHVKLYEGYKKLNKRVDQKLMSASPPDAPAVDTDYALAMRNQSFGVSAAYLHELYFTGLSPNPSKNLSPELSKLIADNYGDLEGCIQEIKNAAISARGWSVLAYRVSGDDVDLRVFGVDSHEIGNVFGYTPLVIIDAWEHAYWMDFGTSKSKYVDNVVGYIDWSVASSRYIR